MKDKAYLNEQWKSDGICTLCRRYSYCKKHCKAAKTKAQKITEGAVREYMMRNVFGIHAERAEKEVTDDGKTD